MSMYQIQRDWVIIAFLSFAGINIFLDGFVPTENLRFRETSLVFKVSETASEEEIKRMRRYDYGEMSKKLGECSLLVICVFLPLVLLSNWYFLWMQAPLR